jgi:hypothetical protein
MVDATSTAPPSHRRENTEKESKRALQWTLMNCRCRGGKSQFVRPFERSPTVESGLSVINLLAGGSRRNGMRDN